MSSDNYNNLIQRPDGRWILSTNHSMSDLMSREEYESYKRALRLAPPDAPVFDTQEAAFAASDKVYSEYGTFSHHYQDWFKHMEDE